MKHVTSRRESLLGTINLYQQLSAHRPSPCRYIPSCSEYAREAVTDARRRPRAWLAAPPAQPVPPARRPGFDPVPPRAGTRPSGGHAC